MLAELPYAILILGAVLVGLWMSNLFLDLGVPQYLSRKVGHGVGGVGYLLSAFMFQEPWWPLILSGGFTLLLAGARVVKPRAFRGVGGSARAHALAEVWFPLSSTAVLAVGWGWLGRPLVAVACILMMCWGDMLTGIVRSQVYKREVKGNWGSVAMLAVCLLLAWAFINPFWLGVAAALAATAAERFMPISRGFWDDNWAIPLVAAAIVFGGLWALGL